MSKNRKIAISKTRLKVAFLISHPDPLGNNELNPKCDLC